MKRTRLFSILLALLFLINLTAFAQDVPAYSVEGYETVDAEGNRTETVNQAKAATAFRAHIRGHFRSVIKGYRSNAAASAAR